jgi:hypothetical protein
MGDKFRAATKFRGTIYIILLTTFSAACVWWTFNYYMPLSAFAAALLKASIAIAIMYVFDKYVMREINTFEELKNGNIAYAIFMLGWFIVVAATISTA